MKENSQDTLKIEAIKTDLDAAVDNLNIDEVEKQLAKLEETNTMPYELEDSKLFAKRIINQNKKGMDTMKKHYTKAGTFAATIALTIAVGFTGIYATGIYKKFNFFEKDKSVMIKTTDQTMTDKEAEKLAKESGENTNTANNEQANEMEVKRETFASVEEVKEKLGVDILMPSYIPAEFERDKEINAEITEDERVGRTDRIYLTYTSKEDTNKRFGISVIKENLKQDVTTVVTHDASYKDKYTSAKGDNFTLFEENGSTMAQIEKGDTEYILIFLGIREDEMHKVIDSVDLSSYSK